jgi:hypothetical protein
MTMDADYSTDRGTSGGQHAVAPKIHPIAELKRIISQR